MASPAQEADMNALDRGSTLIAAKELKFAGRRYRPADKFDYARLGIAHRRAVTTLMEGLSRKVVELTPTTFKEALRFRDPAAGPPRGFSLGILVQMGIMTWAEIAERGWDKRDQDEIVTDENAVQEEKAWEAPEGSWKVFAEGVDEEQATDDTTLWVVPFRNGSRGATRYFVHALDGTNLSGDASISGKDNAETWGRKFMQDRAAAAAAAREGEPDWSKFPENEDDWTEAQIAEFDAFYDAQQPGIEIKVDNPTVQKLVDERRNAEAQEAALQLQKAGENNTTETESAIAGLSPAEAEELIDAMDETELRAYVAEKTGKTVEDLADFTPLALREMLPPTEGAQNDSDIQPGPDV